MPASPPASTSAPMPETPVRGRPRDPSLDVAIVEATLDLLAEDGYGAVTMEAVAARAGVGKATLYRRYPSKEALVVDAVASLVEPPEPLPSLPVRDALRLELEAVRRKTGSRAGSIFPRLVSASVDNPELMQRYRAQVIEPRHERLRALLERAVRDGVLRADVDLDHAVGLLLGPVVYRNLVWTEPPPGPELTARVVDDVLRSFGADEEPA